MTNPIINQDPNSHHPSKMSLTKKLVIIASLIMGAILLLVLWALASKSATNAETSDAASPQTGTQARATDGQPPVQLQARIAKQTEIAPKPKAAAQVVPLQVLPQPVQPQKLTLDMQREMAYQQQLLDFRQQQKLSAMGSDTVVQFNIAPTATDDPTTHALTQLNNQAQMLQARLAQTAGGVSEAQPAPTFADNNRDIDPLEHRLNTPSSPYMLNVGTIIPATLISGINSDLPGQVIASVSQNVYDSRSGAHLLIPQGSRLYGVYDNDISYGQSRVMLVWSRINFPNGTTLNLANMAGMDTQGYAGFEDEVDNHYWKIFGNALLLGMISGGAQAGVSSSGDSDTPSAIADGVTQQFAQTGSSLIQKNLDVQPRIQIRNGYRFNVMVNKDLALSPYIARR